MIKAKFGAAVRSRLPVAQANEVLAQNHVRAALRYLQIRVGGWEPLSKALHFRNDTTRRVALGRNAVSASMTLRVARLAGVAVDDLLAGRGVPSGTCPHCGRTPDFSDETTISE